MRSNDRACAPRDLGWVLAQPQTPFLARILLTARFWMSGVYQAIHFNGRIAEATALGLPAPAVVAVLTVLAQLAGSAAVIFDVRVWLGAGALVVFALAASPLGPFPRDAPPEAFAHALATFSANIGLIGDLMLAALFAAPQGDPAIYGE